MLTEGGDHAGLPLYRCVEEDGVPVRLVGETDVLSLPAVEELIVEAAEGDSGYPGAGAAASRGGTKVRLTSHRLFWQEAAGGSQVGASTSGWVSLRLDEVEVAEALDRFWRSRRCLVRFLNGMSVHFKRGDNAKIDELIAALQQGVKARKWTEGSYDSAATGGLQKILERRGAKQRATNDTLDVALADLESLRHHAAQTVAAARQLASRLKAPDNAGGDAGMQQLLADFGLLNTDGTPVAKGGIKFHEVDSDVARVCEASLARRGKLGLLLAHDVFCLVNRARGTALLSPDEVMAALRRCAQPGGSLRMRCLGSTGALAVSLAQTSDAEVDEQLVGMAGEGPLSAFRLSQILSLTTSEAQYLLSDAEARAALVRDDAPEGVFYYPNFFAEFC